MINYFRPQFLLGLTATPFRSDNKDIFALCGDNVIYEIYLKDAIHRDLLVPFRYFGIYDSETDYSQIETRNGQYVVEQLEKELSRKERANLVLEKYRLMAGRRTLGFCVSIDHAEYMAKYFATNGIKAAAVHQCCHRICRIENRLWQPWSRELEVIFAVDIFNEGWTFRPWTQSCSCDQRNHYCLSAAAGQGLRSIQAGISHSPGFYRELQAGSLYPRPPGGENPLQEPGDI